MTRGIYRIRENRQRKPHSKRLLHIGITCTIILFALAFLRLELFKRPDVYTLNSPQKAVTQPPSRTDNYGLPVRLRIPKLAIDAPIVYMGLTKTGNMAVPSAVTDVGWYKNGALPGNKGSAVLAGHINGLKGQPGVFAHLDKLHKGDILQITDANGTTPSFAVTGMRTYSEDAQPKEVFNAPDGAHLNLITCTGSWDNAERHYQKRLVVFTDKTD